MAVYMISRDSPHKLPGFVVRLHPPIGLSVFVSIRVVMDHRCLSPRDAVLAQLAAFPLDIPQDVLDSQECGLETSPPRDFAEVVADFIVRVTGTEECRPE
ncbi:Ff.00g023920.m01.CDS01 [Fusarium sp. VM40]|nr:Ff.00g023920.m01.CDS01 [Fusarium sp. VM40]